MIQVIDSLGQLKVTGAGGGGGNTGSISAGTTKGTLGEVVFSNSNGVSFGMNGQTMTASHNGLTSQSNQAFSAEGGSSAFQTLIFTNSNGFSFSNTGGSIWGSYTVPSTAGLLSNIRVSAGTTSNLLSALTFNNGNGVSFGLDASTITASHNGLTSQSNQAFSAEGGSSAFQTLVFTNSNGFSFSNTGGSIWGSYTVPTQTNQTIGVYGSSQTTGQSSSSTVDARSLTFRGAGIVSVGMSAGEVIISATGGAGGLTNINVSAGTTSNNLSALTFDNANGISFGLNASTITASYTVPTVTNSSWTVSDAVTSATVGRLAFTNSNGLTLSLSTSNNGNHTVIGSYTVPTVTNSSWTVSDAVTSQTIGRLAFTNANGLTMTLSTSNNGNATVFGSYTVPTQSNQTLGLYMSSNTTSSVSSGTVDARSMTFRGMGVASVGYSGGEVIVSVPAGGGGLTNINISAGTTSNNLSAFTLANSNNMTFGLDGSTVTASFNAINVGVSTFGRTNGTTGTVEGAGGQYIFAATNGLGLSQSTNGVNSGTVTISPDYISAYSPPHAFSGMATNSSLGQNTVYFQPFDLQWPLYASRINFYVSLSGALSAGNSTGTCYAAVGYALYTRDFTGADSRTLNLLTSYSMSIIQQSMNSNTQYAATHYVGLSNASSHSTSQFGVSNANASTYQASSVNGLRVVAFPLFSSIMTPGRYWLAFSNSTITGNAMTNNMSVAITSVGLQPYVAAWGTNSSATNASVFRRMQGWGSYSATTNAFPATIPFTTDAIRAPVNQTMIHFDILGYSTSTNMI